MMPSRNLPENRFRRDQECRSLTTYGFGLGRCVVLPPLAWSLGSFRDISSNSRISGQPLEHKQEHSIVDSEYLGLNEGPIFFLNVRILQSIGLGRLGDEDLESPVDSRVTVLLNATATTNGGHKCHLLMSCRIFIVSF
jgi:hypothetical protein